MYPDVLSAQYRPEKKTGRTLICFMQPTYTLHQLILYFLRLGTFGFGGPVALVGYMHRDLVEERKWISEEDYKEGLALSQLAPGPLAAQLAIYLGYVHFKIKGATLISLAFVLPSFIMVLGLSLAYQYYGGLPWMQAVFYGISAAVIGIITFSTYKLSIKSLGKDYLLWSLAGLSALVTVITQSENILLFIGSGVLYWLLKHPPVPWFKTKSFSFLIFSLPLLSYIKDWSAQNNLLLTIFLFFAKAGTFVFGSGLAIVPFLYSGTVKEYHWLTEQQFLDAVAVAMITPGPVVITVAFIGFLTAGFKGACIASVATFLPCYLLTILPAPYFKKYGKLPSIKAFVDGVTSAAIGAIAGAVLILGSKSLTDSTTIIIALLAAMALWRLKFVKEPFIIAIAAIAGLIMHSS